MMGSGGSAQGLLAGSAPLLGTAASHQECHATVGSIASVELPSHLPREVPEGTREADATAPRALIRDYYGGDRWRPHATVAPWNKGSARSMARVRRHVRPVAAVRPCP